AASLSRPWHALEFKTFDLWTALAAPHRSALPVVVLAIDEPTFQEVQQSWPFPRSLHARVLDRLRDDGALAVGFDVVFADPGAPDQDAAFAQSLAAATAAGLPVVLASTREKVDSASATLWTEVLPLAALRDAGAQHGDAGVQPDDDFVVRRMPQDKGSFSATLAGTAALHAMAAPPAEFIAYRGPRGTFDTRSYYQALEPGLLPQGFFHGKVVLIGRSTLTASDLQHSQADLFNSPFAALGGERLFPGVELQATLLDNLISGDGLRLVPEAGSLALVLLALALLLPASLRWHPSAVGLLAAGLVGGMALLSWLLFLKAERWLAPLLPMAATVAMYGATTLVGYASTRQQARQMHAMFSQYVPPEVVSRLIAQPELLRLGGEAREVTLLFTDLASFTTLSEQLSAEQTVEVLTLYFNAMTPIVHASGGTVDKFIGDAVMAFWGAPLPDPQHAEHAVRAAIAMQQAMQSLGMAGGRFEAQLLPQAQPQSWGLESVEFAVAGHAGSTARPLAKVASGGELSRLALAIAVTTLHEDGGAGTLIFDEIDAGIGGAVGDTVGALMKQLGRDRQVLAVTHLAQVAACADHHYVVAKLTRQGHTASTVAPVHGADRVAEVARMLGGERLGDTRLAHAQAMLTGTGATPDEADEPAASQGTRPRRRAQREGTP
ncbi:MAG: CHASE2 domain-containing protein, partial [Burkholderiaceae bacterium]|nr:CHASE2 domain-containing protein [Burkholderiaceae bacterium]